jgi:hypothetical protein
MGRFDVALCDPGHIFDGKTLGAQARRVRGRLERAVRIAPRQQSASARLTVPSPELGSSPMHAICNDASVFPNRYVNATVKSQIGDGRISGHGANEEDARASWLETGHPCDGFKDFFSCKRAIG